MLVSLGSSSEVRPSFEVCSETKFLRLETDLNQNRWSSSKLDIKVIFDKNLY